MSIDVGGIVGVGILNGTAWHDANFNGLLDVNERLLEGWTVELYRNGALSQSTLTAGNGVYQISGIVPNYQTADRYELRFLAPGAGLNTAKLGRAQSVFTNDLQRISDIVVQSGSNLQNLNLPIEPNGVVYNTITRTPIAGAILRMLQAGSRAPLPESCFYDPVQQGQVTLASGYYRFDINFSDPACASGGSFLIDVAAPSADYVAGYSQIIPPVSGPTTAAVLGARLSGKRGGCDPGHGAALRGAGFGVRALARGAAAQRLAPTITCTSRSMTVSCRARARSSTTTSRSTRSSTPRWR